MRTLQDDVVAEIVMMNCPKLLVLEALGKACAGIDRQRRLLPWAGLSLAEAAPWRGDLAL